MVEESLSLLFHLKRALSSPSPPIPLPPIGPPPKRTGEIIKKKLIRQRSSCFRADEERSWDVSPLCGKAAQTVTASMHVHVHNNNKMRLVGKPDPVG